jgi:DNA primase
MRTAQGRVSALQFLLPAIQRVSDKLERAAIANDLAGYLGVERGLVLDHFKKAAVDRREKPMEIVREPVRAVEKILLNSLLLSGYIRREVIPRLRNMPEIGSFTSRRILEALFTLHDNQPEFRFAELEARLGEPDRALLSSVAFADEMGEENYTLEQAVACLARLEAESHESQRGLLRRRVEEAERAGNMTEALRLNEELNRLGRVKK